MPADPFTPAELEAGAAAVHQAYLDTCALLGRRTLTGEDHPQ